MTNQPTKTERTEAFFYEDEFYSDFENFISEQDIFDLEEAEALPDDWQKEVHNAELQKCFKLAETDIKEMAEFAEERLHDEHYERYPEEDEDYRERIQDAIIASIDLEKLNSLIPEIWMPDGTDYTVTKQDVINYFK